MNRIVVYDKDPKKYDPTNDYDFLLGYSSNDEPNMIDPRELNTGEIIYIVEDLNTNTTYNDIKKKINKYNTVTSDDFIQIGIYEVEQAIKYYSSDSKLDKIKKRSFNAFVNLTKAGKNVKWCINYSCAAAAYDYETKIRGIMQTYPFSKFEKRFAKIKTISEMVGVISNIEIY